MHEKSIIFQIKEKTKIEIHVNQNKLKHVLTRFPSYLNVKSKQTEEQQFNGRKICGLGVEMKESRRGREKRRDNRFVLVVEGEREKEYVFELK